LRSRRRHRNDKEKNYRWRLQFGFHGWRFIVSIHLALAQTLENVPKNPNLNFPPSGKPLTVPDPASSTFRSGICLTVLFFTCNVNQTDAAALPLFFREGKGLALS
jgi:hypothetical protein